MNPLVLFLGCPGSGKSSLACGVAALRCDWALLSPGSRWRRLAERSTSTGIEIAACLATANPIPDEILNRYSHAVFRLHRRNRTFLFDGNPFSRTQVRNLRSTCEHVTGSPVLMAAVLLRLAPSVAAARMQSRARAGEDKALVAKRIGIFEETMLPLYDSLAAEGTIASVYTVTEDSDHAGPVAMWIDGLLGRVS